MGDQFEEVTIFINQAQELVKDLKIGMDKPRSLLFKISPKKQVYEIEITSNHFPSYVAIWKESKVLKAKEKCEKNHKVDKSTSGAICLDTNHLFNNIVAIDPISAIRISPSWPK